jgi:hypothetical protein
MATGGVLKRFQTQYVAVEQILGEWNDLHVRSNSCISYVSIYSCGLEDYGVAGCCCLTDWDTGQLAGKVSCTCMDAVWMCLNTTI